MNDVYAIVRSLLLQNDDESRLALADMAEERGDMELVKLLREGVPLYMRHDCDMDAHRVVKFYRHSAEARKAFLMGMEYTDEYRAFDSIAEVEAFIREEKRARLTRTCPRCHRSYDAVDLWLENGR